LRLKCNHAGVFFVGWFSAAPVHRPATYFAVGRLAATRHVKCRYGDLMPAEPRKSDDAALRETADWLARHGVPNERNADLGQRTWYRIGGSCALLAHPQDRDQLTALCRQARERSVPVYLLGSGANLLVRDGVLPGLVVRLDAPGLRFYTIEENRITAAAGADLARLVHAAARAGLAGLECLAGVPATLGGALRMNAGGAHGDIGSVTTSLTILDPDAATQTLTHDQVGFAYRKGQQRGIILEATLTLTPDDPAHVRARVKEIFDAKKLSQPFADHSAGCAFKNPSPQTPAGKLIDTAGLKGHRVGGAFISERHANFIAADEHGTADQITALIQHAADIVQQHHGIALTREVVVWPDDGPTLAW